MIKKKSVLSLTAAVALAGSLLAIASPVQADPRFGEAITAVEKWNSEEAIALLKAACDEEVATACGRLLALYSDENKKDEARSLAARECSKGDGGACFLLASYAGFGQGGPTDREVQRESYKKACELGLMTACTEYADLAKSALGGPEDIAGALEAAGRACASDNGWGCTMSGDMLVQTSWQMDDPAMAKEQQVEARSLYRKACELRESEGCMRLADMLVTGDGGEADPARAISILTQSCNLEPRACDRALELRFYQP